MSLIRFLQSRKYAVHRANTRKVKSFIRSYGQLGKSDRMDAVQIARYARERHSSLELFSEHVRNRLIKLMNRRHDLVQMRAQEKNRMQAPEQASMKSSFEKIIQVITEEIDAVDAQVKEICAQDHELDSQKEILKTIPGVGNGIAVELLTVLPELGRLNRKQIASLGGLAPHPNESGNKVGYRRTKGGRESVKRILFMAALSATKSKKELGMFYQRLIAAGKKKMVALTAVMRKILVIANAKMRDFYLQKEGLIQEEN